MTDAIIECDDEYGLLSNTQGEVVNIDCSFRVTVL